MTKNPTFKTRGNGKFPIDAIGASAGGLEATSELLNKMYTESEEKTKLSFMSFYL